MDYDFILFCELCEEELAEVLDNPAALNGKGLTLSRPAERERSWSREASVFSNFDIYFIKITSFSYLNILISNFYNLLFNLFCLFGL